MNRRTLRGMEPHRYRHHLANMALLGLVIGWMSAVLSIFDVWGTL